jgi:hypothetical protein
MLRAPSKRTSIVLSLVLILGLAMVLGWSRMINLMLPADSRPASVAFPAGTAGPQALQTALDRLEKNHADQFAGFDHIAHFEEAGITSYAGPATCLGCHEQLTYEDQEGAAHTVDLMDNLTNSVHYRFFAKSHPNVYGFNGELADNFAMGKINRPCPKPGSFAMTAWAEIVVTTAGDTLSEGCGQCHIGGQYQAPLGEMMPLYSTQTAEKEAIDCLICHSVAYDMNERQVVIDPNGRKRWGQDRSLAAALSVGTPTSPACLRCHQHNFGGDVYVESTAPHHMESLLNPGTTRPRVMHPGSKRGTPFSPEWDVHAAAGVSCIECHHTHGHLMAKGTHTTTMMANDLPQVEVDCLDCHDNPPHDSTTATGRDLNAHQDRLACQVCHIPSLHPDNVTRRDFSVTEFEDDPGIYIYHDEEKSHLPGEGLAYVWWNGDCTFLGNPIGDNPNGAGLYRFYTAEHRWPEFADFDYDSWYEETMRPIARAGRPSKLYAMKKFNGRQHIDLGNIGPFGGMFVPYNLPEYYKFGKPEKAARLEVDKGMMGMMYGLMFKYYMLDRFMSYMAIDGWNTDAYSDVRSGRNVEARWLPNDAMLEASHAIRLEGALTCHNCHGPDGVLDWKQLGYTEEEAAQLARPQGNETDQASEFFPALDSGDPVNE